MNPKRFVFHPLSMGAPGPANHLTANEPSILLEEVFKQDGSQPHKRHDVQSDAIGLRSIAGTTGAASPLFEDDLSVACREYLVRRIWVDDTFEREQKREQGAPPVGNAPPRTTVRPSTVERLAELAATTQTPPETLYLFNVIVALEWVPTPQRLRRLEWAFRRASDYLYDVTNGGMAFGQVVFAGPDWLHCADIQILASNRYLPRSWVSALHEPKKYTPIRLGRGLWVRDRRIVIDWDEPEGYRSIVHEWAHYALGLKDEYMHAEAVVADRDDRTRLRKDPQRPTDPAGLKLVDVDRQVKSESIMASVQGNSELANPLFHPGSLPSNMRTVIEAHYVGLQVRFERPWSGPGQLPLPLPHFRFADELAALFEADDPRAEAREQVIAIPFVPAPEEAAAPVVLDERGSPQGRWEIFLARFVDGQPTRLRYQGELDARTPEQGFTLLGYDDDDEVLLVGGEGEGHQVWSRPLRQLTRDKEEELVGLQWELRGARYEAERRLDAEERSKRQAKRDQNEPRLQELLGQTKWQKGVPDAPLEATLGASTKESGTSESTEIREESPSTVKSPHAGAPIGGLVPVSVDTAKTSAQVQTNDRGVSIFDIAGARGTEENLRGIGKAIKLPSLDGYAVSEAVGRSGERTLIIADFSQGGPPRSAPSMVSDPIAAGAASGEALILCNVEPEDEGLNTDRYRVVTAGYRGIALPAGYIARSPVFTVSSNIKLLEIFTPSLLIVNAAPDQEQASNLRICRFDGEGDLEVLPTYLEPELGYAIAPLRADQCGSLISTGIDPDKEAEGRDYVERFVLAVVPAAKLKQQPPAV